MNAEVKPVLSTEQIEEFNERGILQVDFGFSEALLDRIRHKIWHHYDPAFRRGELSTTRVQDGWKLVDEVRQLATDSRVTTALAQLLGRKALPFQTLNFPVGTSQLAHSDTVHFSTIPAGYMAGVWVALEDIDEDNGPLAYYPGSHKLPYYGMHDLELEPGYENYRHYEQRIQDLIDEHSLQVEYGVVPKGTAIIWHANVLHGGAPQKDKGRSRHSQVTHYYFEGCRYYTPMESTADEVTFRNPRWIPARAGLQSRWQQSRLRRSLSRLAGRLRGRSS
ncbi:MAG: phytanoyl-CoA dioxygenase family protein [Pseudohongiellaceae bacterium]